MVLALAPQHDHHKGCGTSWHVSLEDAAQTATGFWSVACLEAPASAISEEFIGVLPGDALAVHDFVAVDAHFRFVLLR